MYDACENCNEYISKRTYMQNELYIYRRTYLFFLVTLKRFLLGS